MVEARRDERAEPDHAADDEDQPAEIEIAVGGEHEAMPAVARVRDPRPRHFKSDCLVRMDAGRLLTRSKILPRVRSTLSNRSFTSRLRSSIAFTRSPFSSSMRFSTASSRAFMAPQLTAAPARPMSDGTIIVSGDRGAVAGTWNAAAIAAVVIPMTTLTMVGGVEGTCITPERSAPVRREERPFLRTSRVRIG